MIKKVVVFFFFEENLKNVKILFLKVQYGIRNTMPGIQWSETESSKKGRNGEIKSCRKLLNNLTYNPFRHFKGDSLALNLERNVKSVDNFNANAKLRKV